MSTYLAIGIPLWIAISILVSWAGAERKIGRVASFWIATLLSPITGAFVVIASERNSDTRHKRQVIELLSELVNNTDRSDRNAL